MIHLCEIKRLKMILFRFILIFFFFFFFIIRHQNVTSVLCPSTRSTDGNEFVYCAQRKREETIIGSLNVFGFFYVVVVVLFIFLLSLRSVVTSAHHPNDISMEMEQPVDDQCRPRGSR